MQHENDTKNKLLELMLELTAQSCYEMSDLADTYYRMRTTGELFHEAEQPDLCTIAGLRFGAWRVYQQHVEGRTDCTLEQFKNLTFTQWRDCVLALAWQMPKAYLLHFECVAVAVAYRYLLLGPKVIEFLQRVADTDVTGAIDIKTAWAVKRYAPTRDRARELAADIMLWKPGMQHLPSKTPEGANLLSIATAKRVLDSLDLTDEERNM